MDMKQQALKQHYDWQGKIEVISRAPIETKEQLSIAYTPGVAEPCLEIQKDTQKSFELTRRGNLVAVVTDGSAVLGLGNIGPEAGMPVMEGKCALFKTFANVDAFPLCIKSNDVDEIVRTVYLLSGSFGGINLEDISAPRCFEVEKRLKEICDIPVFHDDQHGTAIVAGAALYNALKFVGKKIEDVRIVINGPGAAGISIAKHLLAMGAKQVTLVGRGGILYKGKPENNPAQEEMCAVTNLEGKQGTLRDALCGADVFVGVSAPNVLTKEDVGLMASGAVLFPMANPVPEIFPDVAIEGGAAVVGTGRSDYPNQINNVLAFPGIFRGALDVRATEINEKMCMAATYAIANTIDESELTAEYVIPRPFDKRVADAVAKAVAQAARDTGVARL